MKYYTQQEIEMLSVNPYVKNVREDRLTLTYEFRMNLFEKWQNGESLQKEFLHCGFDMNIIKPQFIVDTIHNFKRHGRPNSAKNKNFGIANILRPNTAEEIKTLIDSGLFIKCRNGIAFHSDFIDRCYHLYPEQSIEETLQACGMDPDMVGYQRIYTLKKLFDGEVGAARWEGEYEDSVIEILKHHHYIKRISKKQISFHDQFYQDAFPYTTLHIDRILDIFEIDHTLLPIQLKNRIKYKLNHWKMKKCLSINKDDIDFLFRIERNKQATMTEMIESGFMQCRMCIPYLSKMKRKALCQLVSKLPEDTDYIYSKRAILEKIGISKTNYYAILKSKTYGMKEFQREEQDKKDIEVIRQVMDYKGYPKGSRMITMMIPRITGLDFSRGKILRLMRKGGLKCTIRKANNHKRASEEMLERNTKANKLKRQFRLERPLTQILTDVSYLKYGFHKTAYLSCLKDASSGRILGCVVSERNDESMTDETLLKLKEFKLSNHGMIHSDQGVLYLSTHYQIQVKKLGLIQSMSRRGNCWDNASQESYFGHFKDECDYRDFSSIEEVRAEVDSYMSYYNEERPQWTRNKMTPIEFEEYLQNMDEEEFALYVEKEKQKYERMMAKSTIKAKKRSIDIGVEA